MNVLKLLDKKCVRLNSPDKDKISVIRTIAKLSKKNNILSKYSEEEIFQALTEREELSSTGLSNGVAIPHCALKDISNFVFGILTIPKGIKFDSLDGEKTKLFVFVIAPQFRRNEHIKLLSIIAKILKSKNAIDKIISSNEFTQIYKVFSNYFKLHSEPEISIKKENCLIQVIVQVEEKFNDILEIFHEIESSNISVIESHDASKYLHSLPLFASFWDENKKGFNRIILAIVPKKIANKVLRKINILIEELENHSGIMVIMNNVDYSNGSLNV